MMAQSLFSALNFLAKVHARLRDGNKYFYTEEHKKGVKDAVKWLRVAAKNHQLDRTLPGLNFGELLQKEALTLWKPPRPGDCANETAVFKMFVEAMSGSVDLEISATDADHVWIQYRNALAHMALPKSMVETDGPTNALRSFRQSARFGWIFNVDRLTVDVQTAADWLCKKIDEEADEDRIADTLRWILDSASESRSGSSVVGTVTTQSETMQSFEESEMYSVTQIPPHHKPTIDRARLESPRPKEDSKD